MSAGIKQEAAAPPRERPPESVLRGALRLAGRDARSSWASFPATAVVSFLLGLIGAAQYRNALAGSAETFGHVLLDFFMIAIVAIMSSNLLFNRDYFKEMSDESFNGRLSFLRSLPIPAKSVVLGRVFSMSLALACAAPMFFLAPYLAYGGLREEVGLGAYMWYFGIWLGYALFALGVFVLSQFGFNWSMSGNWLSATLAVLIMYATIVLVSNLVLDDGLALSLLRISETNGSLAAIASILAGILALASCAAVAAKRLGERDIG